jgi:glycerophosphoryl diester phosphodiesterase
VAPEIRFCNMSRQGGNRAAYVDATIGAKANFIQLFAGNGVANLKPDVDRLHAAGVKVNWFNANEEPLIRTLADAGVDYILTDNLDLCLKVLADYGSEPVKTASPQMP